MNFNNILGAEKSSPFLLGLLFSSGKTPDTAGIYQPHKSLSQTARYWEKKYPMEFHSTSFHYLSSPDAGRQSGAVLNPDEVLNLGDHAAHR